MKVTTISFITLFVLIYSNLVIGSSYNNHLNVIIPTSSVTAVQPDTSAVASSSSPPTSGSKNPVFQLAGYIKDSFVRMKDGTVQLYTNHQRCKEIRVKQRHYLETMASTLPPNEQKTAKKYQMSAGGITYEEFDFLQKGKEDRGRLANMVFMMVFAPNFVPYAFMFFPDMLPSSFQMPMNKVGGGGGFVSPWDMISRERAHAVLQTMIDVERSARVAPMMSNLNPFGKGRVRRTMEKMDTMGHACGALLSADEAVGRTGAELVMKVLEDEIYSVEEPKKSRTALTFLPKSIVKGLGRAMDAPSSNSFLPAFLVRGKVLNNLSQIKDADEFIVEQKIDLNALSIDMLQDACSKRLIGGPGFTKNEMVKGLSSWMDFVVKQPSEKTKESGKFYNGNLARVALLCYNAVDGARDTRASSFLPRLMYQGQIYSNLNSSAAATIADRKSQTYIKEGGKQESSSSDACSDGTESFQVTGPNGYSPVRDCAWVRSGAKKLTAARCEKHDINSPGKYIRKDCAWISRWQRYSEAAEYCPKTCGLCTEMPNAVPSVPMIPSTEPSIKPLLVSEIIFNKVFLGAYHSCFLLDDGTLKFWGQNQHGQLGAGYTPSAEPTYSRSRIK